MIDSSQKPATTMRDIVLASALAPGAGQLLNRQKTKGIIILIVAAFLAVDIMVHIFIVGLPLFGAYLSDMELVIPDDSLDPLKTLGAVILVFIAIWVWAMFDAISVFRNRESQPATE